LRVVSTQQFSMGDGVMGCGMMGVG
jgi:hypothetical protein